MKILLTGGGTGGHVYPALALAEAFAAAGDEVAYVGLRDGLEARLVPKAGVPFTGVDAAPLRRRLSLDLLRTLSANAAGLRQASRAIEALRPDAVIATGGYVSFATVAAAWLRGRAPGARRPFLGLLEPNAVAGLTNRLLAPLVDEVWWGLPPGGRPGRRDVVTGVPVRSSFDAPPSRATALAGYRFDPERSTALVVGGSQGARSLNAAVAELLRAGLPPAWQLLQICGTAAYEQAGLAAQRAADADRVRVFPYLEDPLPAYAAADLVVARAGASTLAELARLGKPALLVPYPHATADHQRRNAEARVAQGAARTLADARCGGEALREAIAEALEPATLHALRGAAQKLAAQDARAEIVLRVRRATASRAGRA